MADTLLSIYRRNDFPVETNNTQSFQDLQELGLIQPDYLGVWQLTETGRQTASRLLKR
jgi:Mn-dependent DtxR family transcriptional regulator